MQKRWKRIAVSTLWILTGVGAIVLLGAAMQQKEHKRCSDVKVEITGAEKHIFIDEKDVLQLLNGASYIKSAQTADLDLRRMESMVERNPWVKNAEMYIDNNQVLQVRIEERQPVARVFTLDGSSFYVDSGALRLPLSDKLSARVPVFTGFPSGRPVLSKPDSALLKDIVSVGRYISSDSFWTAQVAQVNITPRAEFEIVPVIGDHVVMLGDAEGLDRKFNRLYAFYKQAWLQNGIDTYERLDVQYDNQVVAVRKGTARAQMDSARAHQLVAEMAAERATDSINASAAIPAGPVKVAAAAKSGPPPAPKTIAPAAKTKAPANNKINKKTLTNGKNKTKGKAAKKRQAKAVMKRS